MFRPCGASPATALIVINSHKDIRHTPHCRRTAMFARHRTTQNAPNNSPDKPSAPYCRRRPNRQVSVSDTRTNTCLVHCHPGRSGRCRRSSCCRCCESYCRHSPFRDTERNLRRCRRNKSKSNEASPSRSRSYNWCYWASLPGHRSVRDSGLGRCWSWSWRRSATPRHSDRLTVIDVPVPRVAFDAIEYWSVAISSWIAAIGNSGPILVSTVYARMFYMVYEGSAVCSGTTIRGF